MLKIFKKKQKKIYDEFDLGPSLPADQLMPIIQPFSEKFIADGKDPFKEELNRLKGLNVDDLNFNRRDSLIDKESKFEESLQREALVKQLNTMENLMGEKFAELILIFEKEEGLIAEKKRLETEIASLETKRSEWLKKGKTL